MIPTPESISADVLELCGQINPDVRPVYIIITPGEGCEVNNCFDCVRQHVAQNGGRIQFGWSIWKWPRVCVQAEHHAVYEPPAGPPWVDFTPSGRPEVVRRLFLPDDRAVYDFGNERTRRDSRRLALNDDPLIKEFFAAAETRDAIRNSIPGKGSILVDCDAAKIDRLKDARRKQLDRLQEQRAAVIHHAVTKGVDPDVPMKPSGVEWLGEIPVCWEAVPLWTVVKMAVSNVDKTSLPSEQPVRLCNYVDVYKNERIDGSLDFMAATASAPQIEKFSLREGDVIITKDSETPTDIGVPAIVVESVPLLVCGCHLAILRSSPAMLPEYLLRLFETAYMRSYLATKAQGVTRFGLSQNAVTRCPVPVPPLCEQEAIGAHIRLETAKIDSLMSKYQREIELLAEYRASLISHAVTGKIDIRGLAAPAQAETAGAL